MFEHAINIFESILVPFVLYSLCKQKKPGKTKYLLLLIFSLFQFSFITVINYFSMTESVYMIIEILASYAFVSLISNDSASYKFFVCAVPYNVIGIENTIQNTTVSYILFHKIDYYLLAEKYRMINVTASQVIHVLIFYYVIKISNKMETSIEDKDYILLALILFVCNFMTICFETVGYHFENQDLFMVFGIWSVLLFVILIIYLFVSIYRHSVYETKQEIELEILESQQSSNRKILDVQSELYQLRHDMKHFIQALKNPDILKNENDLQNTIGQYESIVQNTVLPITTMSSAVNYVLNIKREEATRKGIDFSSMLNITHEINMEDDDLYLLLSNLLDNAIEHIGMMKKIRVEMNDVGKMFVIKISNSIDYPVIDDSGNFIISNRNEEHGYGTKTIENILSKYDGYISYIEKHGELLATAIIMN